jgi:pentatricopeptide repeat protein
MWEDVRESNPVVTAGMMGPVVRFYCRSGEVRKARQWYERLVDEERLAPELETYVEVLRLCAQKGETGWAQEVFGAILSGGPRAVVSREAWDVVLQWADIITRDSNEISRLLTIMMQRAATTGIYPSIETFNELIRFAIARGDYKAARKHHKLAIHRKFAPNRRTLELQIEYLVLAGKVKVAPEVYEQLRAEELPPSYPAHSVQLLLQALCREPEPDVELINRIYTDLGEWSSPLQIGTTTALLNRFLTACQFNDVITLLSGPSCAVFSAADRRKVIHEMGEYIGRPTTSIEAAWDTYQILYQVFPELSVRQRTDIMRLFFTLGRSDMATMVFKHMRGTPGRRPGKQSYILALSGVAYSRDIDALKVIHNALKLDQAVDLDTQLTNALMNAYNRCGVPLRAVRFWEDIKQSTEGPDYQSISVVFEAYGNLFEGTSRAKILWGQLKSMGVKPTVENYRSYIEALGKGELFEEAFRLAREMELNDGVKPDVKL